MLCLPLCMKNLWCVKNSFILVGCHNLQIRVLDSLQRALEKMWAEEKQRFLLFWSLYSICAVPSQAWAIIPVFWPREFHGLYSSWGHKELDMTEWLLHFTRSHIISLSSFTSFLYLPWLQVSVAPKCQSFVANRNLLPQNFLNDKQKCEKSSMTHVKFLCMLSHVGLFVTPMDCSPPGSSVHGIFQVRILEWVAISSARGSSQPRDWTCISCITINFLNSDLS